MANEWDEIGERLQGLGSKLKAHFEESGPNQWPDALNKLGAAVEDLFKTASNAVQDEAVRSDVRDVGHRIADAVATTLGTAGEDIRGWFGSGRKDADGASTSDTPADGATDGGAPADVSTPTAGDAP